MARSEAPRGAKKPAKRKPVVEAKGPRVPSEQRRRQLLDVATVLVSERGAESVTVTDVAVRAKVSRPLVYRLFPTRQALVRAVLDDFSAYLSNAYRDVLVRLLPGTLEALVEGFVQASCDAIEARGAGPWRLLDGTSGDPEIAGLGRGALRGVLAPWQERLAEMTGRSARRSGCVLWIIVCAGRAALDGWIDGAISRREAVSDATRTITALLVAFAQEPQQEPTEEPVESAPPSVSPKKTKKPPR